jgi:enamine deaminase RidA (YjgF/YER057c/UK114 family)
MTGNLEGQTKRTMDGINQTFDAAGASFKDVVHMFVFRARPQMGDIGRASRVINSYFAPFNHKPTSTNIAVLELALQQSRAVIRSTSMQTATSHSPNGNYGISGPVNPP